MKKWLFLICATVLFRPVFPVLDYVLRYDYISQELCVNKAKPELHCNGKCYLMKRLAAAAESEKPASPDKKHTAGVEIVDLFLADHFAYTLIKPLLLSHSLPARFYPQTMTDGFAGAVFHPPTVFC